MENQQTDDVKNEEVKANAEAEVVTEGEETETNNVDEIGDKLKKEAQEWKDKFYYLAAEMDNLKRRVEKEKENLLKFGSENILKGMIEVIDNFDRTLDMIKKDEDEKVKNIVVGIEMVNKMFLDSLKKFGLEQLDCLGDEFDPNFHEAMAQQEAEGKKQGEIIQVFEKGYMLNGRLIRAAKVIVAK